MNDGKEFKKNLQSDGRRFHQILKTLSDPAHPFSHFDIGTVVWNAGVE